MLFGILKARLEITRRTKLGKMHWKNVSEIMCQKNLVGKTSSEKENCQKKLLYRILEAQFASQGDNELKNIWPHCEYYCSLAS